MDKWLGDGGMAILGDVGVAFTGYDETSSSGTWTPTERACNPGGAVHGGVVSMVVDAIMNFALAAATDKGDRAVTLEIKTSFLRAASQDDTLAFRGDVTRLTRSTAFARATITDAASNVVAEGSGTFAVKRHPRTD